MKGFKFEEYKRKQLPEFIRRSKNEILNARKAIEKAQNDKSILDGLNINKQESEDQLRKQFAKFFED